MRPDRASPSLQESWASSARAQECSRCLRSRNHCRGPPCNQRLYPSSAEITKFQFLSKNTLKKERRPHLNINNRKRYFHSTNVIYPFHKILSTNLDMFLVDHQVLSILVDEFIGVLARHHDHEGTGPVHYEFDALRLGYRNNCSLK